MWMDTPNKAIPTRPVVQCLSGLPSIERVVLLRQYELASFLLGQILLDQVQVDFTVEERAKDVLAERGIEVVGQSTRSEVNSAPRRGAEEHL